MDETTDHLLRITFFSMKISLSVSHKTGSYEVNDSSSHTFFCSVDFAAAVHHDLAFNPTVFFEESDTKGCGEGIAPSFNR